MCFCSDFISEINSSDVTFNAACEMSQPMGKTEFSSTTKTKTNSISQVRESSPQTTLFLRLEDTSLSFQNNPKNLDPSYKTDLDLWDCLGRVKLIL